MKTKKMRVFALILSLIMLLCACGQGSSGGTADGNKDNVQANGESGYPEYLNLDSAYPVIKDEYDGTIKLTVAMVMQDGAGKWEDLWISKYLKEKYNIELEVECLTYSSCAEKKSLMLSSGELPDMMINMGFTANEIVKYGQEEGLFLKCDEYMNETLTPSIMHYWTDDVRKASVTPDGHVYSLPKLTDGVDVDQGALPRLFINKAWLDELNIEMPRTLDEFVDAMYAIKEADPAGVGSENLYPLGGGMETEPCTWYLLNALGYNTTRATEESSYGVQPCIRDGEVVIPVYDMEVYQEYLKLMNQFYEDGIINSNFFTIESTEVNAQMNNGQNAMYDNAPFVTGITTWDEWEACYPLTSEWQTEPETITPETTYVGGFVISADTEYPELCMRFADLFYNNETDSCRAFWGGTGNPEYDYDYVLRHLDEESQEMLMDTSLLPEGYTEWTYMLEYIAGNMVEFGAYNLRESEAKVVKDNGGEMSETPVYDLTNPDNYWRSTTLTNVAPYTAETFPSSYFTDAETTQTIIDLETVIKPYVKEQVAMFITGARPLSETDDFVEELKGMGMEELVNIYKEIYAVYNQ